MARVIRDESDVRAIIKAVYGSDAVWVEAARGGTAGAHDVVLHNGLATVSAELKAWHRNRDGGIVAQMRREQVRLHHVAGANGWASVVVFGVVGEAGLWAIPSCQAPRDVRAVLPAGFGIGIPVLVGVSAADDGAKASRDALQAVARVNGHRPTPHTPEPSSTLPRLAMRGWPDHGSEGDPVWGRAESANSAEGD